MSPRLGSTATRTSSRRHECGHTALNEAKDALASDGWILQQPADVEMNDRIMPP